MHCLLSNMACLHCECRHGASVLVCLVAQTVYQKSPGEGQKSGARDNIFSPTLNTCITEKEWGTERTGKGVG